MKKIITLILVALVSVTCMVFTACVPANLDKAKAKMEEAGYTVVKYENDHQGLLGGMIASKGLFGVDGSMTALLFKTKEDAENFYVNYGEDLGAIVKGKWAYYGTENAIKDFD